MDRLAALFEQFSLPEIARLMRRTSLSALAVAVVALGVTVGISKPLVGLGVCVGLALGLGNIRLITHSVAKVTAEKPDRPKRVLATKTVWRLSFTTLVIIGFGIVSVTLGIGIAGGIAVFYLLLLVNLIHALFHPGASGATV